MLNAITEEFISFKPRLINLLHLFTLFSYALAQPLYDLLGRNAEFFAIRNNSAFDILFITAIITLFIPAIWTGLLYLLNRVHTPTSASVFHLTFIGLCLSLLLPLFHYPIKLYPVLSSGFLLLLCALLLHLYLIKKPIQLFLTYLSPGILIFPLLFLFNTPINLLLYKNDSIQHQLAPPQQSTTPVIFIVLDELPVTTLMAGPEQINVERFPAIASLAQHSTWYINTRSVAEYTTQAIPALLTGQRPDTKNHHQRKSLDINNWLNLPTYSQHPDNLFTYLSNSHRLHIYEGISSLCPDHLCDHVVSHTVTLKQKHEELIRDVMVVYLHIILPEQLRKKLPRIDMGWSEFVFNNFEDFNDELEDDDIRTFKLFTDSLNAESTAGLYFIHTSFPHSPWKYLPSGKLYSAESNNEVIEEGKHWQSGDSTLEPLQRHILQTMFADHLLTQVFDKLRQTGLYDKSLIILTADHGASFQTSEQFRVASARNIEEISDIPLLIKAPGQRHSVIKTTPVESIDIVPTIYELLNIPLPDKIDGTPAGLITTPDVNSHTIISKQGKTKTFDYSVNKKLVTLNWKLSLVGKSISDIYAGPDYGQLIGSRPDSKCSRQLESEHYIDTRQSHVEIDPEHNMLPIFIAFKSPFSQLTNNEVLGVTINEKLAAILMRDTATIVEDKIHAILDERQFSPGSNNIRLHAIQKHCGISP